MRVLVTGADGYLGALLAPALAQHGHEVTGLDTGFYREGCLYGAPHRFTAIQADTRSIEAEHLAGYDAVVHLAELSNDPLGQLNPALTYRINHQASVRLAQLCRAAGVARFVYSSSCSVYGVVDGDEVKTEQSSVRPQTAYAECKVLVERDVACLASEEFSPVFLRNATAYGPSPRMRFDIVLNNLAGLAWTTREIAMTSDGTPWRPLVHTLDICQAVACVLDAPREAIHGQIFNVGDDAENYQVREIAAIVADVFPGCGVRFGTKGADNRSYRVSFAKIRQHLPTFECRRNAGLGARQLLEIFQAIGLSRDTFEGRPYTRLKQLEHLLAVGALDADLFWT
ncbi:MAG TPA: SDR family oxidoreductase [Gemmatimonadales bacterium]|nr:SDR family oxidoreductase [Gemmatimonadales bacterium]